MSADPFTAAMNQAWALWQRGELDQAIASLRAALAFRPDSAAAHTNLGTLLRERGLLEEAIAAYREAVRLNPSFAQVRNNLAVALKDRGDLPEAEIEFHEAVRLNPQFAEAHCNLANLLREREDWQAAWDGYSTAIRLQPSYVKAFSNRGMLLLELGRVEEALEDFDRAVRIQSDFAEARLNRGVARLLLGLLAEGWPDYEWRQRCKEYPETPLPLPHWDGTDLTGKTILLVSEQGLGDTLQFIRYAPLVKARGARVLTACPRLLQPLLAGCPGIDHVVPRKGAIPAEATVQALLPSLPAIFGTTPNTIPAAVPYLTADPTRADFWRQELAAFDGFKVGIVWKGSAANLRDRWRSVSLAQFEPLSRVEGVRLFSLQVGPGREELETLGDRFPVIDLAGRFDVESFADAAAVVKNLDLIVTVDTALAHLAGALAVPVWVALPFAPDWRWMLNREDSPWYPTMRLFRQPERGNWQVVFERICQEFRVSCPVLRDP